MLVTVSQALHELVHEVLKSETEGSIACELAYLAANKLSKKCKQHLDSCEGERESRPFATHLVHPLFQICAEVLKHLCKSIQSDRYYWPTPSPLLVVHPL
jgi:hypothetical protein